MQILCYNGVLLCLMKRVDPSVSDRTPYEQYRDQSRFERYRITPMRPCRTAANYLAASILVVGIAVAAWAAPSQTKTSTPTEPAASTQQASAVAPQNPSDVQPAASSTATTTGAACTASATCDEGADEQEFADLINHERTSRGLNALDVDPVLVAAARAHSAEMCALNYFDHTSPTAGATTPMDRYLKTLRAGGGNMPSYLLVGENIYYCSELTDKYNVEFAHQALMNSPGHRRNILDPRFQHIGVGTYRDPLGRYWVTEMFMRNTDWQSAGAGQAPG